MAYVGHFYIRHVVTWRHPSPIRLSQFRMNLTGRQLNVNILMAYGPISVAARSGSAEGRLLVLRV